MDASVAKRSIWTRYGFAWVTLSRHTDARFVRLLEQGKSRAAAHAEAKEER
jgi:hypothetical protein